jgi:Lar family restriction alleviation protein
MPEMIINIPHPDSQDMIVDLKPCPFCRGTKLAVLQTTRKKAQIRCDTCKATGPYAENKEAFVLWNKRPRK